MNKAAAKEYLRLFDFKALFLNELGWDDHDGSLPLKVCDETITLDAVAEKRGDVQAAKEMNVFARRLQKALLSEQEKNA